VYRFIEAHKAAFAVQLMCEVLEVSRSGYYEWRDRQPSPRQRDDARLTTLIRQIHADSRGTYGSPRVHAELLDDHDERIGVNRVARLMAVAGIEGISGRKRGPRTTTPAQGRVKPPDLVRRDFTAPGPNRLWLGDITYLATDEGWLYLAVLLDAFSRRIVGWATADHLGTDLPLRALEMALRDRQVRPGTLVHHTDSGSQYLSGAYSRRLARADMRASAAGSAYDNAMCESWFGTIKNELVYRHRWATREAADLAVFHYIHWYNHRRRHSALDMRSPVRYEQEVTTPHAVRPTLTLLLCFTDR
jgi:putative transposase